MQCCPMSVPDCVNDKLNTAACHGMPPLIPPPKVSWPYDATARQKDEAHTNQRKSPPLPHPDTCATCALGMRSKDRSVGAG